MTAIVVRLSTSEKNRLRRWSRRTKDAGERTRAIIVLHYASGKRTHQIADAVGYHPSAVRKVRARFLQRGAESLTDQRALNGTSKIDDDLRAALVSILKTDPQSCGWSRVGWTQELLALELFRRTRTLVSTSTIGRMLTHAGARWGQARPIVACPWPKRLRRARIREIEQLIERLPSDEVALHGDEVDIDLNPRIGRAWMLPGTQMKVLTPGKNRKIYLAGALDARSGRVVRVWHERKTTDLFLKLLRQIARTYPDARRIHLVVDNYGIHKTRRVRELLAGPLAGRIELHFLPPYCPDSNPIERLWRDLHAAVTRNHRRGSLAELQKDVERFLRGNTPWPSRLRYRHLTLKEAA